MKKQPDRLRQVRQMLLKNQQIKVIASELGIPSSSVHRAIPLLGIRRVWLTDGEWKALQQVREIVGPLK